MQIILDLFKNLLPVLAFIGVGYLVKQQFNLKPGYISKPLLYGLIPPLVIYHFLEASDSKILIIPAMTLLVALGMNVPALLAKKSFAKKENPHLLKGSFTFFNVLFFGIPTVTAIFDKGAISTLICVYIGTALYGNIIGYYQVAKTKLSSKEAAKEVLKVPYIYVFMIAITLKALGVEAPKEAGPAMDVIGWIVSALGMSIVGLHLTTVDFKKIKLSYFSKLLGFRNFSAIVIIGLLVLAEYLIFQKLESEDYQMLALLTLFPIASNISLFASFLETEEERFSLLVLLSIGLSLILVPIAAQFLPS